MRPILHILGPVHEMFKWNGFVTRPFLANLVVLCSLIAIRPLHPEAKAEVADLPIINAHDHLQGRTSAEELIKRMDEAGVVRMVLMALVWAPELGSDRQALEHARKFPGRFMPFVAFQRPGLAVRDRWLQLDGVALNLLNEVEGKLKGGGFFGLGEILVRHYDYAIPEWGIHAGDGEVDIPADSPLMFRIAELAMRYRVPMLIHAEGEPLVAAAINRLLRSHPNARVIWAHNCGRQSAVEIKRFLTNHLNLFCDLAGMINLQGYGSGWPRSGPWTFLIVDRNGHVLPDMKELFEAFPDRFVVGGDHAHYGAWQYYVWRMNRFRFVLSQFSPVIARKFAHENAEFIFGLPPSRR